MAYNQPTTYCHQDGLCKAFYFYFEINALKNEIENISKIPFEIAVITVTSFALLHIQAHINNYESKPNRYQI